MPEIEKILFPCDLSGNSIKILPYALSVSEKYGSRIYLLHVVQDVVKWGTFYAPRFSWEQCQEEALKHAEKAMEEICEEQLKGYLNFQRIIFLGDPVEQILKTTESEGIDLVIMGTHGRKGLEHTVIGSVAEKVVQRSPVPVLVINPYKIK
jgi:nucleotide-binding universal stress UspA family protein